VIPSALFYSIRSVSPFTRKIIVAAAFFFTGGVYVFYFLWPQPIHRQPLDIPRNLSESIGFMLSDSVPVAADVANIVGAFLLGLGVYSVFSIHVDKIRKGHRDSPFSIALIISVFLMLFFGYLNYYQTLKAPPGVNMTLPQNWHFAQYARDFLFNGVLQQMDAAMFSLIAFYILSAAYRAFRIRSIEATVLLATALILVLKVMGVVADPWSQLVHGLHFGNNQFGDNFTFLNISNFLQNSFQSSSIRAVDFGVGIGALAMALRLWLSIDKQTGT